jgi:hypothetical protein
MEILFVLSQVGIKFEHFLGDVQESKWLNMSWKFCSFIEKSYTECFNYLLVLEHNTKNILKCQINIFSNGTRMARGTGHV